MHLIVSSSSLFHVAARHSRVDLPEPMDLRANTRLLAVALDWPLLPEAESLSFAIPTLHTLTSHRLTRVLLGGCNVNDVDAVLAATSTLEQALLQGPSGNTLKQFHADGWRLAQRDREISAREEYEDLVRCAFGRLWRRGILYDGRWHRKEPFSVPLPEETTPRRP